MSLRLLVKVKKYVLSQRFLSPSVSREAQTTLGELLIYSDTPSDTIIAYLCGQWK